MIFAIEKTFFQEYLIRRLRAEAQITEKALSRTLPDEKPATKKLYTVINGDAHIPIQGILSNHRSFFDLLFGLGPALLYDEIIAAVQQADQDPAVRRIVLDINSPGRRVDGLDDASQAVAKAQKPTLALVRDMAASAAYWIASQADRIMVTSPVVRVGSIGVIATVMDDKALLMQMGLREIIVISTDSPRKYVDPATEAGQVEIREVLDGIHRVFIKRVATGRKVPTTTVNESFGRGALVMANMAEAVGMIDGITGHVPVSVSAADIDEADEAKLQAFREKIRKIG